MSDAVGPAPSEQGWGKLLLALTAFLFLPLSPPLRALLPVEETLLLLVPAIAACCMVGWWAGGRLILAIVWTGLAAYMLALPSAPGSFYHLICGWSLLLAGGFGLICLLGSSRPFLPRAFGAIFLALALVLVMSARGPLSPARAQQAIKTELGRRNVETAEAMRRAVAAYPEAVKDVPSFASLPEESQQSLKLVSDAGAVLFPSLLLLESLLALALAWATYHRLSRARLGAPLGHLKDFRFNDQFVWGLIAGLAIVFIPALGFLDGLGRNLLVFFGALYALRGFGVLSWFVPPGAFTVLLLIGLAMLWWPVPTTAGLGFLLMALAAFGLGLGDTWADWRRRARPTT